MNFHRKNTIDIKNLKNLIDKDYLPKINLLFNKDIPKEPKTPDELLLFRFANLKETDINLLSDNSQYLLDNYFKYNYSTMLGASGALFGVLAGFALLFPNTELMLIFPPIPIKAKFLIGGYIALEIFQSIKNPHDQIAHLAHVGGAIVGIIIILIWRRTDRKNFY